MAKPLSIQNVLPEKLSAGVNLFLGIGSCRSEMLSEFIRSELAAVAACFSQSLPPGFTWTRKLYNSVHVDPTRHRPSSEALWRRFHSKGDFPAVNPLVDLTNLLSLKFQICYGLYDLELAHGQIVICLGGENDRYQGIGKELLNFSGRIVLRDGLGAFGNPSADSKRTRVNEKSRDIGQVLFFHPGDPQKKEIMAESQSAFKKFFALGGCQAFLLETNTSQGIFPEGEPCKTSASQIHLPTPG